MRGCIEVDMWPRKCSDFYDVVVKLLGENFDGIEFQHRWFLRRSTAYVKYKCVTESNPCAIVAQLRFLMDGL